MVLYDVDQEGWGSSLTYEDGDLNGDWDPQVIIIHWGGLTRERDTDELAFETLRSWQRYHLSKGWQDIAYNYAVTEKGTICRLRGENHGGHTSGENDHDQSWSSIGVGVVWVGGQSDEDGPSDAAKEAMARLINDRQLPVMGHRDTKATACPGDDWLLWIREEGWNNQPPDGVEGEDMEQFIWDVFNKWTWDDLEVMRLAGMWAGNTDYFKGMDADPAYVDVKNLVQELLANGPVFAAYEDSEVIRRGESVELI